MARVMEIQTPLGADLLFTRMSAREELGRLFHYRIELVSLKNDIDPNRILGKNVTVKLELPKDKQRFFNGYVTRFAQVGMLGRYHRYDATVVPWLWFLTRSADCRIFQDKDVPQIVKEVLESYSGLHDFKLDLTGKYAKREYCVQYRETDFNFVSRLMEEYGILYFFEHDEDKHTLVLANSPSAHKPCPEQPEARCNFAPGALLDEDTVTAWQMEQELRPGKYALTDYNFETPSTSLAVNVATTVNGGNSGKYEIYDFPGEYLKKAQGEQLVKIRMEEEEAPHTVVSGASTCAPRSDGAVMRTGPCGLASSWESVSCACSSSDSAREACSK